jgi:tetratricopeptide (TPR) repeat protein
MTDLPPLEPDSPIESSSSVTNVSGGVNVDAQRDVNIGGDVVGRDKIMQAGDDIVLGDQIEAETYIEHATIVEDKTNRTALYAIAGIVGMIVVVLGILTLRSATTPAPVVNVLVPTNQPTATPAPTTVTPTATPTATPIFSSDGRYHVAIAKLNDQNASKKYSIEPRLEGDLRQALREAGLSQAVEVRVISQPAVDSESAAQDLVSKTQSDVLVWGLYDDAGIRLSVLLGATHAPTGTEDTVFSAFELPTLTSGTAGGTETISYYITGTLPSNTKFLALYVIGHLEYLANRYSEGYRAFDAAMKELPNTVRIEDEALMHFFQARALPKQIDTDVMAAGCEYARAIQLDPTMFEAYNNLGVLLMDWSDIRYGTLGACLDAAGLSSLKAGDFFSQALQLKPDLGVALANLGTVTWNSAIDADRPITETEDFDALALQKREQARRQYEAALKIDPSIPVAYVALGNLDVWDGNFSGAIDHFKTALKLRPQWPQVLINLGQALALAGRDQEAEAVFRQALPSAPGEAHLNLGNLYSQQGDTDHAYAEFQAMIDKELITRENYQAFGLALLRNNIVAKNWVSVTEQLKWWDIYDATITDTWRTSYVVWLAGRNLGLALPPTIPITLPVVGPSFFAWTKGSVNKLLLYDLRQTCPAFSSDDQNVCIYDQSSLEAALAQSIPKWIRYRLNYNNTHISGEGMACPYIYTFNAQQHAWQFDTTILYKLVGPQAKTLQTRPLLRFDGRLRLQEVEPEISYVDMLAVRLITADGREIVLQPHEPLLKTEDGQSLVLHQGDQHELTFDVPPGALPARQAWVIAAGYYLPYVH